jgi:hypothetical protein
MDRPPVLYLDLDDTLVSWCDGHPEGASGSGEFILWALPRFEIRWLTTWCPGGEMAADLLADLAAMLRIPVESLQGIRGFEWEGTGSKLNGIAWLEHYVLGRPFIWLEDENGVTDFERSYLDEVGLLDSYVHCNVSRDPGSLTRAHQWLRQWLEDRAVDEWRVAS